jgi:steroid 5-alpha reductase family enzyme
MPLPNLILLGGFVMAAMMAGLWLVQRRTGDAGIVDVGWAAGLCVLALLYAAFVDGDPLRRALVAVLAATWSFRLAGYLLVDRVLGKAEDGRYQTLRAKWGPQGP